MAVTIRPSKRYNRPAPGKTVARQDALRRTAAGLLLTAAVVAGVFVLIFGGLLAYGLQHRDTMFAGTSSGGVSLGGMTFEESRDALQAKLDVYLKQPIDIVHQDTVITATPEELGVHFDVDATVARVFEFGRQSSLWQESRNWLDALAGGYEVTPIVTIDPAEFAAFLEQNASSIAVAPRQPSMLISEDGAVTLDPGENGLAINVAATFESFRASALVMTATPLEIVTIPVEKDEVDPLLASTVARAQQLAGEPLQLSLGGVIWEIPARDLLGMLEFDSMAVSGEVAIDARLLHTYISSLQSDVFTPGQDASIANGTEGIEITPAIIGYRLDVETSLALALEAMESDNRSIELATIPVSPNVTDADVADAASRAGEMIDTPFEVTWADGSRTIDPHFIATSLTFETDAGRNPKIVVKIDESVLGQALTSVAPEVRVEPTDAELRWINGQVTTRRPEDTGRELDVEATTRAIAAAVLKQQATAAVITRDVLPEVNGQMASTIQFPDVLATGTTEYGSSSADRFHNVELAANRLNGAMVPPGGTFSFNEAVGEVTINSGYRTGYGIIATNGIISTIPSVGGGICQVATTVFHAAFRAGMPIERRSWHLYWIPRYGQPPSGMRGLDATVDADYNLDFKFRNSSDNWIAIVTRLDGANLTFELVGTNTGWDVQIDQPIITNVQPADQTMVYEDNASLPAGTRVFVETAHEGFDATIRRIVRHNGEIIDEVSLFSTYAPSRNVTLVGTGQ